MWMKGLLIVGIALTIAYIIAVVFNLDRQVTLLMKSIPTLAEQYKTLPLRNRRIVLLMKCKAPVCEETIKSLLDQSVRAHDIAIEATTPQLVSDAIKPVVTIHKPNTVHIREQESNTIVIPVVNGVMYDYDFVETHI